MIYTPGIRVYIKTEKHGTLDVSEDLVNGTMVRRSDGVSTFDFGLKNPRRKYDRVFTPNDTIVVLMKRLTWVRTFTGYLNTVPLRTAWPTEVSLSASCSLKRLQYWHWDPYATASMNMVMGTFDAKSNDGGTVANMIMTVLEQVVGWPRKKVHIGGIPADWYQIAFLAAKRVHADSQDAQDAAQAYADDLGIGPIIEGAPFTALRLLGLGGTATSGTTGTTPGGGGSPSVPTGAVPAGKYGGQTLTKEQVGIATTIYNIGVQQSMGSEAIIVALMAGMQESGLRNLNYGDRDSLGIFQMRPSQGWGSKTQVMDPTYECTKWFKVYSSIPGITKMSRNDAAQAVEVSGNPTAYGKWETMAVSLYAVMQQHASTPPTTPTTPGQGSSSNAHFIQTALNFVKTYDRIPYKEPPTGNTTSAFLTKTPPDNLDCSSFVQRILRDTNGTLNGFPRVAHDQAGACQRISADKAMKIPGALMFKGGSRSNPGGVFHVEMSLGDGKRTVGAHHSGTYAGVTDSAGYWTFGGLVPGIVYNTSTSGVTLPPDAAAGSTLPPDAAAGSSGGGGGTATASTAPYDYNGDTLENYNPKDPLDQLFGDLKWYPIANTDTDATIIANGVATGSLALMNDDSTVLVYLKNLFASTMKSFCSAPNGDLIGWFPDYYGIWGTAAILRVEPIELQDFNVNWSDDFFVTHQYVQRSQSVGVDIQTGLAESNVVTDFAAATTKGIATIDNPELLQSLFGVAPENALDFARFVYRKFGARPDFQQVQGITSPRAEFFMSIYYFMLQWAYQYQAQVPTTWMPEAWPGMLMQVQMFNFQAYITSVTHSFAFGEGGKFETQINLAAPAYLPGAGKNSDHALDGLPLAGGYVKSLKNIGQPPDRPAPGPPGMGGHPDPSGELP